MVSINVMLLIILYFMVGAFVTAFTMNSAMREGSISVIGIIVLVIFPVHTIIGIIIIALYTLCKYLMATSILSKEIELHWLGVIGDRLKLIERKRLEKAYEQDKQWWNDNL